MSINNLRGGSWLNDQGDARAASRSWYPSGYWCVNSGFRVVCDADNEPDTLGAMMSMNTLRGGSWGNYQWLARAASRSRDPNGLWLDLSGFRVVCEPSD